MLCRILHAAGDLRSCRRALLRRPIRRRAPFMRTSSSSGSAISSGIILPIRLSVLTRWRPKRESHYATFRSSFRRANRPAVISYIRLVWITPRAFYTAGDCWVHASLSARSPTPAALPTIQTLPANFAAGSVIPQVPIREIMPSPGVCVTLKVRHPVTTCEARILTGRMRTGQGYSHIPQLDERI